MEQEVEVHHATVVSDPGTDESSPESRETRSVKRVGARKKTVAVESMMDFGASEVRRVAEEIGVDPAKVESWIAAYREGGAKAIRNEHVSSDSEISAVLADLVEVVRGQLMEDVAKAI